MVMLSPEVQNAVVQFAGRQLEKITESKVEIGHIDFEPFRSLNLHDIYVSDHQKDTLFYFHQLNTKINWIKTGDIFIWLSELNIDSAKIYFKEDSTRTLNLNRFLNAITGDTTQQDTASSQFRLKISRLNISKTAFRLKSYQPATQNFGVNYEDMFLKDMQLNASDFELLNSDIYMDIKHLSAREQSGAVIDTLRGQYAMDSLGIRFTDLYFQMDSTYIKARQQKLLFNDFKAMDDFINKVQIESDITQSRIRTKDLAWFVPALRTMDLDINFRGKISGPVSRLKAKNLQLKLTDSTFINTSFSVNGLPDFTNTFMYVDIHELKGYRNDLKLVPMLLDDNQQLPIPEEINNFGFKGNISGFTTDLVTDGVLTSNIGNIRTNITYKELENKAIKLKGSFTARRIALDSYTGNHEMLGKTSLTTRLNGTFQPGGQFNANLKTRADFFDFNQYRINNIAIDGTLTHEAFDGDIHIKDKALDVNFTGHFEYGTRQLTHRFLLNIRKADLATLNLDEDSISTITCDMIANVRGTDPNTISGNINLMDVSFKRSGDSIRINELAIESNQEGVRKNISIRSDFFDIGMQGHYQITDLSPAISNLVAQYAPQLAWDTTTTSHPQTNFKLSINMINIQPLLKLFVPDIAISNNTKLTGTFNRNQNLLLLEGESEKIEVADMKLNDFSIRAFNAPHRIHASVSSEILKYADNHALKNLRLSTILQPDSIELNVNWDNSATDDTAIYSGNLNTSVYLESIDSMALESYAINIEPSYVVIADSLWQISRSRINVDTTSYAFENFSIANRYQHLRLQGTISENDADTLRVKAGNINISPLNLFTKEMDLRLKGVLNADIKVSQVYTNPFMGSKIKLNQLTINDQLIGDTKISTEWDPFLEMIHLEWLSTIMDTEVLNIIGDYDPANSRMNFRLFIDRFNLNILEPYLEGVLHDLEGLTTAEIILKGTIDKPELQGVVIFDRTAFTLDYTQTRYEITDWIDIAPEAIYFNNVRITDEFNHYGHLNGKITHKNFQDIAVDINFDSRNLMFLNTRREHNDTFFGTVYASGNTNVSGSLDDMVIDITMKTDKNTRFYIPLESSEEVSKFSFIEFQSKDSTLRRPGFTQLAEKEKIQTDDAMSINMNLNITPEAQVQIIFDSKIGDIIKSRGSADMNISMDKSGDISIYGDYIIEKGDYLFTLQDVFQKHLTIAKGSSLSWAGDPEDAVVDIDAIYHIRRASIYNLTFNPDHQELVVPVETHLMMTGGLESPNISFNLDLPSSVAEIQEQLNNLPQEDINKQVLSLLVMNRFLPLPGARTTSRTDDFGMESNASELLSNQVSNWLSQISGAFDIGFNYTPGDEVETQEYEVAVSTQLLNNRVTIQSNVGVGGRQVNTTSETENTSNIAGDFQVDVKLNRSGKLRVKAYAKSNEDIYTEAESTQGVGIFYKEEFNTFGELWRKIFGTKKTTSENGGE